MGACYIHGSPLGGSPAPDIRQKAMSLGAQHFTKHDLRRTCATGCARLGASDFIVSKILGHATQPGVQVTQVYNRYRHLSEMASALNAWPRMSRRSQRART